MYKIDPVDSVLTHNQNDVYFCILCYDAYGAAITDNIAYFQAFTETLPLLLLLIIRTNACAQICSYE